jgi:kynureninase
MEAQLHALLGSEGVDPFAAEFALALDASAPLRSASCFLVPRTPASARLRAAGSPAVYLTGHSLGLQPTRCAAYVAEELEKWGAHGVEGHFQQPRPWVSIDECVAEGAAALVGARRGEVAAMGSLTANLHTLMCSFYRPAGARTRILIEAHAFPSDAHVVASQAALHGLDPAAAVLRLAPREGEHLLRTEDVIAAVEAAGDTLAVALLPGVQYLTGQALDVAAITAAVRRAGGVAGWDLAHAVGNVPLSLHDWDVDFAAWCSYKYLNAGPGGIAGAFVHERHGAGGAGARPRLAGWWGHRASDRFAMGEAFVASPGAQGFMLSNPCVLAVAALRASLEEFSAAGGIAPLRKRSRGLTGYLEALLRRALGGRPGFEVLTPADPDARGAQLSIRLPEAARAAAGGVKGVQQRLLEEGVVVDVREVRVDWFLRALCELHAPHPAPSSHRISRTLTQKHTRAHARGPAPQPNVMRVAPAPLYNTAEDVRVFVTTLVAVLEGK